MEIKQDLIPSDRYKLKSPYIMQPKGICVHNTANDASAKDEIAYMKKNDSSTSFHIALDDIEAIQAIPFGRNAWHAGDGGKGEGNRNYISIEICYSKSGGNRFIKAEQNAVELIAQLLKQFGWSIDHVKKHQDFNKKYCPHRTLDLGWQRFLDIIQGNIDTELPNRSDIPNITLETQSKVNTGDAIVKKIQYIINSLYKTNINVDGYYGSDTKKTLVKWYQTELNNQFKKGLVVDGSFGPKTKAATSDVSRGSKDNISLILQSALYCNGYDPNGIDGSFGPDTEKAVKSFQAARNLKVDGVAGKNTWEALLK